MSLSVVYLKIEKLQADCIILLQFNLVIEMKHLTLLPFMIYLTLGDVSLPIIDLPLGQIEGTIDKSLNGRTFYSFEGVPYAKPPVGKRRFKEPEPIVKPWKGVLKAKTVYKCMQCYHYTPIGENCVIGDEDCLYLNIYSPSLDENAQLDVIVYIHGGAFMFNHGGIQKPHYIMDKDVVSVTLNYRLGPLGFLSTENDLIPGNNGIKDQVMALEWVNEFIQYFGGNPNSITIFGMSAGGASVHLHMLMPKSKGLFQRAISQSGVSTNPWVLMEKPLEKTKKLANSVGCDFVQIKQMTDCLRKKSARQIVDTVKDFQPWLYNPFSPFGVVVDSWASDPLITEHPLQLVRKGSIVNDVPWIVSMVASEGLYPAAEFYSDERIDLINSRWNDLLPHLLDFNFTVQQDQQNVISEKIKEFYLKQQPVTKSNYADFVKIFSDRLFRVDIEKTARLQASVQKSPIYSYYFTYRGTYSRSEYLSKSKDNLGASHADDTSYFYKTFMDTTTTQDDRAIINLFLETFTSFAKTGKPQPTQTTQWNPLSKNLQDNFQYLKISGPKKIIMESQEDMGNRQFWETLPIKENEKLFNVGKEEL